MVIEAGTDAGGFLCGSIDGQHGAPSLWSVFFGRGHQGAHVHALPCLVTHHLVIVYDQNTSRADGHPTTGHRLREDGRAFLFTTQMATNHGGVGCRRTRNGGSAVGTTMWPSGNTTIADGKLRTIGARSDGGDVVRQAQGTSIPLASSLAQGGMDGCGELEVADVMKRGEWVCFFFGFQCQYPEDVLGPVRGGPAGAIRLDGEQRPSGGGGRQLGALRHGPDGSVVGDQRRVAGVVPVASTVPNQLPVARAVLFLPDHLGRTPPDPPPPGGVAALILQRRPGAVTWSQPPGISRWTAGWFVRSPHRSDRRRPFCNVFLPCVVCHRGNTVETRRMARTSGSRRGSILAINLTAGSGPDFW